MARTKPHGKETQNGDTVDWIKALGRSLEQSRRNRPHPACSWSEAFPAPGKSRKVSPLCPTPSDGTANSEAKRKRRILGVDSPTHGRRYKRDDSQSVGTPLQRKIRRMRNNPTEDTIRDVLDSAAQAQLDGSLGDEEWAEALDAATEASETILDDRIDAADRNPTVRNVQRMLESWGEFELMGGEGDISERAREVAIDGSRKLARAAEFRFRNNPTADNYRLAIDLAAQNQLAGGNVSLSLSQFVSGLHYVGGKKHTVQAGDSLSGLSERYYGNPGFWDVIVEDNLHTFTVHNVQDPDLLPLGIVLTIP